MLELSFALVIHCTQSQRMPLLVNARSSARPSDGGWCLDCPCRAVAMIDGNSRNEARTSNLETSVPRLELEYISLSQRVVKDHTAAGTLAIMGNKSPASACRARGMCAACPLRGQRNLAGKSVSYSMQINRKNMSLRIINRQDSRAATTLYF